jgi:hypothetical protein
MLWRRWWRSWRRTAGPTCRSICAAPPLAGAVGVAAQRKPAASSGSVELPEGRYARAPRLRRSWPRTPGKGYCQGVGVRGLCPRAGEPASEYKGGGGGFQSSRLGRRRGCVVGDLAALHSGLIVFHASWGRQTTRSCQTGYWSTILHRISVPCHAALSSTDAPTNETCRCYTCCSILKIHTGACISRTANGSCLIVSGPATRVLQQRPLATGATGLRPQGEVCVVTKLYRAFYVRSRCSGF